MVKITENSLRDGQQSLLATRMRTDDLIESAKIFEKVGFYSVEVWGGATYDCALRYLDEDPFERLAILKQIFLTTPLQMLLRGQNLVGYRHYGNDVVREFVRLSASGGIDIFRIFDALNDSKNLKTSIEAVKKEGKIAQGAICYTTSPIHTTSFFVQYAKELVNMGCDSIAIKDMAGLITPYKAFELTKGLKEELGVSISFHSHSTSGFAFGSHLKALEAGADVLDLCNTALSDGTSHPSTQAMVATLKGTKYDSNLSLELMEEASVKLRSAREKYSEFESKYNSVDTRVLLSQIPGGMMSNLASQLKEQNALDKMDLVMEEIARVREDFGYVPLVTPTSQIVGTQAVLNVLQGHRYKSLTTESKNLLNGFYGKTPAPVNSELLAKIEKVDFVLDDEMQKAKSDSASFAKSHTDIISYAMFGDVAKSFFERRNSGKLKEPKSTSQSSGGGLDLESEIRVLLGRDSYSVKLEKVQNTQDEKIVGVSVDGQYREVRFQKGSNPTQTTQTSPQEEGNVVAPMAGVLTKLKVEVGDRVKKGDVLAIVEAMKMENEVLAPQDGEVKKIILKIGEVVSNQQALFVLED